MRDGFAFGAKGDEDSVPDLNDPKELENLIGARKMNLLEERLRAIEGIDFYGAMDADGLCLVPGVVIPPKFKTPEFEKYDGTKCPVAHLTMYCRKMAAHTKDEKLLMHVFQDSLTGSAMRWYVKLDRDRVSAWNELARAFIAQYKHIVDIAPDRLSLQNMEKKSTEGFKEYAQRWRDMASQVQPPLTKKETTMLFINTFKGPYYDLLVGNATKNFSDMVLSGEIIENAIRNGKINGETIGEERSQASKQKGDEVQLVDHGGNSYPCRSHNSHGPRRTSREKPVFDPIPVTYTELLPQLIANHLVAPAYMKPLQPPYPDWYDPDAHCEYHMGGAGHSTENCTSLKYKVRGLLKAGLLNFEGNGGPYVTGNPLPNHPQDGFDTLNGDANPQV